MAGQEIAELLAARGVRPRREWLEEALQIERRNSSADAQSQAERCFARLADLNSIGAPVLPPDLHSVHKAELPGPYILQVDEVSDVAHPTRDRYQERNAGVGNRCLKLSMTDGVQRVFGIEYRPIPQLKVLLPAGSKIAVRDVCVRRGLLLLVPEILVVLGGVVEQLELARERVVEQVNKPPRGNRNPRGTTPSQLVQQLSAAAWPSEGPPDLQRTQRFDDHRSSEPERSELRFGDHWSSEPEGAQHFDNARTSELQRSQSFHTPAFEPERSQPVEMHEVLEPEHASAPESRRFQADGLPTRNFSAGSTQQPTDGKAGHTTLNDRHQGSREHPFQHSREHQFNSTRVSVSEQSTSVRTTQKKLSLSQQTLHSVLERRQQSAEAPRPSVRNENSPFTYLALLQKRFLDSGIKQRGRIKCFLTAVKLFRFNSTDRFILLVHVDDGSLITLAEMDHEVVQRLIGHSPEEVNAAVQDRSSEEFRRMKSKIDVFQKFLTRFQGYMDVECSDAFTIVEIQESVPASDAWLLLDRVENCQTPGIMDISP